MMYVEVEIRMETKDIILELRNKAGLSQDELAEKVFVTRQAVSRWENGETTPNTRNFKFGGDRCFGIAANMEFILISTYEKDGENPELIVYKKR